MNATKTNAKTRNMARQRMDYVDVNVIETLMLNVKDYEARAYLLLI